ncbi:MAG: hypothetical protein ACYTDT_05200 [Planctomycetota bacterium]|jgi:hypothetical protein
MTWRMDIFSSVASVALVIYVFFSGLMLCLFWKQDVDSGWDFLTGAVIFAPLFLPPYIVALAVFIVRDGIVERRQMRTRVALPQHPNAAIYGAICQWIGFLILLLPSVIFFFADRAVFLWTASIFTLCGLMLVTHGVELRILPRPRRER